MLRGAYRFSGDPADELTTARRFSTNRAEGDQPRSFGPLTVEADASARCANIDGIDCTIDGQLYEWTQLAEKLGLNSSTDAEFLARGFRRYGEELLGMLRGSFSLALWDATRRQGSLS